MNNRGSVTLFALILAFVVAVVLLASASAIARQSREITLRELEGSARGALDSGVEYVQWLLSANGGGETLASLANTEVVLKDDRGEDVGRFRIQVEERALEVVTVSVVGSDTTGVGQCFSKQAELRTGGQLVSLTAQVEVDCE